MVRETILPRLMRRYAAEGTERSLAACNELLASAPAEKDKRQMLASLELGLCEAAQTNRISKLERLPGALQTQLDLFRKTNRSDETLQPSLRKN